MFGGAALAAHKWRARTAKAGGEGGDEGGGGAPLTPPPPGGLDLLPGEASCPFGHGLARENAESAAKGLRCSQCARHLHRNIAPPEPATSAPGAGGRAKKLNFKMAAKSMIVAQRFTQNTRWYTCAPCNFDLCTPCYEANCKAQQQLGGREEARASVESVASTRAGHNSLESDVFAQPESDLDKAISHRLALWSKEAAVGARVVARDKGDKWSPGTITCVDASVAQHGDSVLIRLDGFDRPFRFDEWRRVHGGASESGGSGGGGGAREFARQPSRVRSLDSVEVDFIAGGGAEPTSPTSPQLQTPRRIALRDAISSRRQSPGRDRSMVAHWVDKNDGSFPRSVSSVSSKSDNGMGRTMAGVAMDEHTAERQAAKLAKVCSQLWTYRFIASVCGPFLSEPALGPQHNFWQGCSYQS